MAERSKVFIAYCFPEKRWLDRVQAELDPVVGNGRCVVWDERKLKSGVMWKTELPEVLATTKVAMMIVSDLFLESDFVTRAKLPALLEVERKNGLDICWVLASHCLFELAGLKEADAGNRVAAALDGLGSSQRDAEAAAIARKVAALLGIEPPAPTQAPGPKAAAARAVPPAAPEPKQVRKKRKGFGPKTPEQASPPPPAPIPPATPAATREIPPIAPAPAAVPAPAPASVPVEPPPNASSPVAIPPPIASAVPSPAKATPAPASPPLPIEPAAPSPPKSLPTEPAPAPVPTPAPSPAKPLPAATTPLGLEPAPAPAAIATLTLSLDATIQIRQATVLKLSRFARWLLFAAGAIALASVVVAVIEGFTHFLLVAGFAAFVAAIALRLHARSRFLGQGLVGMRYTRSGLADDALLSRQREALMRKADEYLAQN